MNLFLELFGGTNHYKSKNNNYIEDLYNLMVNEFSIDDMKEAIDRMDDGDYTVIDLSVSELFSHARIVFLDHYIRGYNYDNNNLVYVYSEKFWDDLDNICDNITFCETNDKIILSSIEIKDNPDFDFTEDSKDAVREVLIAKAAELNAKIDKIQNGNCNSSL